MISAGASVPAARNGAWKADRSRARPHAGLQADAGGRDDVEDPAGLRDQVDPGLPIRLKVVAGVILFGTVLFNWALAFVNTRVAGIGEIHVIGTEVLLVGAATLIVIDRRIDFYVIVAALVSYFAFVMMLKGYSDPKPLRDLLIPVVFFYLGLRLADPRVIDKVLIAIVSAAAVLAFWEMLSLESYLQFANVRGYYIAKGALSIEDLWDNQEVGLFMNGTRYMDRGFFSFLGDHRISGAFLEPVSLGNFGAIAIVWIAVRNWGQIFRTLLLSLPVLLLMVMADARFGLYTTFLVLAVLPFARIIPVLSLVCLPLFLVLGLTVYGDLNADVAWDNTLPGRILLSGQTLAELSWQAVLGIDPHPPYVADSGYAYVFANHGVFAAICLGALFFFLPSHGADYARFRLFVALYLSLSLIISGSLFSIKTAALIWAMAGILYALDRKGEASPQIDPLPTGEPRDRTPRRARHPMVR